MKVFINARFLTQATTGVQRYAIELVRALDGLIESDPSQLARMSFVLVAPRRIGYDLGLRHIPLIRAGRLSGHLWEQIELPFLVRGAILVSLANASPLATRAQIVTIHDATVFAMPETYSLLFRTWYQILLRGLGRRARHVVTDSSFSQEELVRLCAMPRRKTRVIYPGSDHMLRVPADYAVLGRNELRSGRFVLAVSSLSANKNLQGVLEAVEQLGGRDFEVAFAGGANPRVFGRLAVARRNGVKRLGYVSDGELRALYEHAGCLVYPSFYEGFGLPPVEAMVCGCPVIASRSGALPEVCGDAALYCDPASPKDIAAKLVRMMNDADLRNALRERGRARAQAFSWRACARELTALVGELIEEAARGRVGAA